MFQPQNNLMEMEFTAKGGVGGWKFLQTRFVRRRGSLIERAMEYRLMGGS